MKITTITTVIAFVTGVFTLTYTILADSTGFFDPKPASVALGPEKTAELRREIERIIRRQEEFLAQKQVPEPVSILQKRLDQIEQRQERLERIIMEDPNKALELPLLRRDIQGLKDTQNVGLEATRKSVEQVYDLSKWLIGAMALGVISLAVNTFMRRRDA